MSSVMTSGWQQAAEAADLTVWLDKTTPMFFRYIGRGCFQMGSRGESAREEPLHQVRITQPFFMGTFPVTQAQWRSVVEQFPDSGLESDPSHFKGDARPVEEVSWDDAVGWCKLIVNSQLLRELQRADGKVIAVGQFDLPTEAQWEYACRAGTEAEYHTGDGEAALAEAGWFTGNFRSESHPVGELAPNSFGLYDMHGNVDEWCHDAWDEDAYKNRVDGAADPVVSAEDVDKNPDRVIRGGSWNGSARCCRLAFRLRY